jgi:hypothetical protein
MKHILQVALVVMLSGFASAAALPAADFYVATNGNDAAAGTLDAPFATLDRARAAVQVLKQNSPGRATPIVVVIRGGTYFLGTTLTFTAADSGTAQVPVIYEAYPGEAPVISGGQPITGWSQDPNTGYWVAVLPSTFQNFEQLFVNGQRRFRPRTTKTGYLSNAGPVYLASQAPNCGVQVTGEGYECFDRFKFKPGDLLPTYQNINDVEIDDFEKWTMAKLRLKSIDTVNNIAYLTGPTAQVSGSSGFILGHRYLVENAKEALSQPGEWYLDRGAKPWTITYIPLAGEDMAAATIIAPQLAQVLVSNGLSYITFQGLTFSHDNWVVPPQGHLSYQDEPSVPAAVSFTQSSYITLDSCTIAHTGGWSVEFEGTGPFAATPVNQIVNSALYDLGTGGIRIGAWSTKTDTDANVAQYDLVQNTVVAGGGRTLPAGIGTGIWIGNSHNNTVAHNEVYDFYSGAIGVCVPTPATCPLPHDNIVEFNHVYQLGQGVTSDFGGIYLATYGTTGNKVLNNKVHDVTHNYQDADGYGGEGIYLDNETSNVLVQNNLVYRTSQSTLFNHDGINNTYSNNILAYGRLGMMQNDGDDLDQLSFNLTKNLIYTTVGPIQKPAQPGLWACSNNSGMPVPCSTRFNFDSNLYWNPLGGAPMFVTNNGKSLIDHTLAQWQALGEDVHSFNLDPLFVNPGYPADDFALQPGSPTSKIGFTAFDPNQAGRTAAVLFPPPVPQAFPLQTLDPIKDYQEAQTQSDNQTRPLGRRP